MSVEICYSVVSSPRLALQHFKGLAPVRKIKSALTAAKNGNSQRDSTLCSPQLNASNVK